GPAGRLVEAVTVVVEVHVWQGPALRRPEALPRPIQAAATDAFLVDAALGRLGVLVRGWDLLPAGGPAESDQGTERQRPAPRPPRPRHAHARGLTRIATTTPATYHRH